MVCRRSACHTLREFESLKIGRVKYRIRIAQACQIPRLLRCSLGPTCSTTNCWMFPERGIMGGLA